MKSLNPSILAIIFALGHSAIAAQSAKTSPPNVLFIAVDDMRVELGCYGSEHIRSPHIDALAERGTLFNRAYCQQAVCNPSRASLLTGLRPDTLGIWDLATHFRKQVPEVVTLPEHFKNHGYHAEDVGKIFHNWRQDGFKGDPQSWSAPEVMHYNTHGADTAQGEGELPSSTELTPRCESRDVSDDAYFDGRIANLAVDALERLSKRDDEPFFLAVGFWKPHAPFNAPTSWWRKYERAEVAPPANPAPPRDVPAIALHDSREILRGFVKHPGKKPNTEEVLALRHGYYAAISYVDAQVGKVVDALDRLGLAEETIIVFWSDHGFHLGEHGLWAKTSNFELDARVPMIIVTPDRPGGRRTDALVELLDLYPTLADLCGLPVGENLEGVSLRPLLDDPAAAVKPAAFTWHPRPAYPSEREPLEAMGYSVRSDRYRYTEWRAVDGDAIVARELYDHDEDPGETVNLAGDAEKEAVIERLSALLVPRRKN